VLGGRDPAPAKSFVSDLASRLINRVQITTDGHRPYLEAIEAAFDNTVDFAALQTLHDSSQADEKRFSPAQFLGIQSRMVAGSSQLDSISTSFVERWNCSQNGRRYTRLSNAFPAN